MAAVEARARRRRRPDGRRRRPAWARSPTRCGVPVGIVGAITPFNFPLNLVAHKIAPALAAGCAVVLKPAGQTPLSALLLAELETEAGLPPGWLNVLVGPSAEIGDVLVEDERVRLITFTGSSRSAGRSASARRKKVSTSSSATATPVVVEADADIEEAATKLAANAFSFAGQSCISVQRVYVARAALRRLRRASFLPKVEALKVGDPADEDTDVGPVIDDDARERILAWIDEAQAGGATVLTGGEVDGRPHRADGPRRRHPDMKVSCQEVFGPLCTVSAYDSLEEAFGSPTARSTGCRRASSRAVSTTALARRARSSSAASRSTRRRPSAPTRCPTAA